MTSNGAIVIAVPSDVGTIKDAIEEGSTRCKEAGHGRNWNVNCQVDPRRVVEVKYHVKTAALKHLL